MVAGRASPNLRVPEATVKESQVLGGGMTTQISLPPGYLPSHCALWHEEPLLQTISVPMLRGHALDLKKPSYLCCCPSLDLPLPLSLLPLT